MCICPRHKGLINAMVLLERYNVLLPHFSYPVTSHYENKCHLPHKQPCTLYLQVIKEMHSFHLLKCLRVVFSVGLQISAFSTLLHVLQSAFLVHYSLWSRETTSCAKCETIWLTFAEQIWYSKNPVTFLQGVNIICFFWV